MPTSLLTLVIQELKAIRSLQWSPTGLSVLVGPNGSGKSTVLRSIDLLRRATTETLPEAFDVLGGGPIRHMDAVESVVPRVLVRYGEAGWSLPIERNDGRDSAYEGDAVLERLTSAPAQFGLASGGLRSRVFTARGDSAMKAALRLENELPQLRELGGRLQRSGYFRRPELALLRESGSAESTDVELSCDSKNLFTVLKNWRLNSDHADRLDFVVDSLKELFPGFRRIDFAQAGQRTSALLVGGKEKLQPTDWSDGFSCCLAMLSALTSVKRGVCAIDEPENSLHPELIRRMVELMREWSRKHDTTVILATHSPVVLNEFREEPEKVFVMQPGRDQLPVRLDELKKREWLQHFALGDLYVQNEVGAPTQQ